MCRHRSLGRQAGGRRNRAPRALLPARLDHMRRRGKQSHASWQRCGAAPEAKLWSMTVELPLSAGLVTILDTQLGEAASQLLSRPS